MKTLYRAAASLLAVTALSGCAVYADDYRYGNGYPGYERSQGVPSGYLPPPRGVPDLVPRPAGGTAATARRLR